MKVGLFISKDQHISLLQAPTPFLSPNFSLSPSFYTPLSFLLLGKWENCPWLDSVFQRIQFSFVHTWSDPVTGIKCVFCLIQRARALCADGHSPLSHTSASTLSHAHRESVRMSMHAATCTQTDYYVYACEQHKLSQCGLWADVQRITARAVCEVGGYKICAAEHKLMALKGAGRELKRSQERNVQNWRYLKRGERVVIRH